MVTAWTQGYMDQLCLLEGQTTSESDRKRGWQCRSLYCQKKGTALRTLSLPFQLLNDAALSLPLMQVAFLGWRGRHAFTSLAFLRLAYAADFPGHLFLRSSLFGYFLLFGFPRCHTDSSVNGLSVSVHSSVNEFVRMGQQKQSQEIMSNQVWSHRPSGGKPTERSRLSGQ